MVAEGRMIRLRATPAMSMRQCLIHIGTHKTGTTAIQHLLARNVSALRCEGYLYPRAGRLAEHPGHHNLAWQISEDRRFQPGYGTIEDLLAEVVPDWRTVILSSEDFGCAIHSEKFQEFVLLLQHSGFETTLILYVRPQASYLARIYLTLIPFGLEHVFEEVVSTVLNEGEFRWRDWIFSFDYCDLLNRAAHIPNVRIIVRPYDETRAMVCTDFLSLLGLRLGDLNMVGEIVENASRPLIYYLAHFLSSRLGRQLSPIEDEFLRSLAPPVTSTIKLSPAIALSIDRRFVASNEELAERYNLERLTGKMAAAANSQDSEGPYIDKLFSEETETRLASSDGSVARTE